VDRHSLGRFLEACGADGPLRLEAEDPGGAVRRWLCPQPFALIGRHPRADVVLDHAGVSRRHAYLQIIGGRPFFVDLGSPLGIRTGDRFVRNGWLDRGLVASIGPYLVRIPGGAPGGGPGPPNPLASRFLGPESSTALTLEFPDRPSGPTQWRMSRELTLVGRDPVCRLRLDARSVSRFHCALLRNPAGVWVVDLLGRDGTQVNGDAVRWARLADGDELRVGDFRILLRGVPPDPADADSVGAAWTPAVIPAAPPATWHAPGAGAGPPEPPGAQQLALLARQLGLPQYPMVDPTLHPLMALFQMFGDLHREQMGLIREELDRLRELTREVLDLQAEAARRSPEGRAPLGPEPAPGPALPQIPPPTPKYVAPPRAAPPGRGDASPAADQPQGDLHVWLNQRIVAIQDERQGLWQKILGAVTGQREGEAMP